MTDSGCQIAPSTFYAARRRPPSARALSDARLDERIATLRASNALNAALGARKTWRLLNTQAGAEPVARCTVERRMRALGLTGIGPGRSTRTTPPNTVPVCRTCWAGTSPPSAPMSAGSWTSPTCAPGPGSWCTAFVMDLYSRAIVGWSVSTVMDTDFVLGALEQAVWARGSREGRSLKGLIQHSDHGSQYLTGPLQPAADR
ncbi:DDE-type integrase/transposase/recombinase [Actinomyces timonensis]|uniref:DDE-type integrase/transposase/recombinase n=1 Tax=Actinomyces timonensis TaxID=1288391 RepID=A0AAU8N6I5_9ACTO